jgi:hypothetical protein
LPFLEIAMRTYELNLHYADRGFSAVAWRPDHSLRHYLNVTASSAARLIRLADGEMNAYRGLIVWTATH